MSKKNYAFGSLFSCLFFLLTPSMLFPQNVPAANNSGLKVKSTTDFTVTGDGSSENWKSAQWNVLPQRDSRTLKNAGWDIPSPTGDIKDVQYETAFKILYSDKGVYCLFKCEDSLITATLKGDFLNLYDEDVVEVFLRPDTGTGFPVYFEYELSPLNYELPILILNNNGKMRGWEPWPYKGADKTRHAVKIVEKKPGDKRVSWTAELFIPFLLLSPFKNVPPKKGTQWHANFYRIDYDRSPVYSSWQVTRKDFHDPERFGVIEFE